MHRGLAAQRVEQHSSDVEGFLIAEPEPLDGGRNSDASWHCDGDFGEADSVKALPAVRGENLSHQPAPHLALLGGAAVVGVDHEAIFSNSLNQGDDVLEAKVFVSMPVERVPDQATLDGTRVCPIQVGRKERGVLAAVREGQKLAALSDFGHLAI